MYVWVVPLSSTISTIIQYISMWLISQFCFAQEFLDNVLNSAKSLAQCEVFCLKLLRMCVERLNSKRDMAICSSIGLLCTHNLSKISGLSGKTVKLAFEKILLHFSRACLYNKRFSECEEAMGVLYRQLLKMLGSGSREASTLLQHSYEISWEASIRAKECVSLEKILDLKQQALKCLLSCKNDNLCVVFEKAQAADLLYSKAARQKSNPLNSDHYKALFDFHRGILKIEQYLKKILSCQLLVPVCQYALVVVKVCIMAEKLNEGADILTRARRLVGAHQCQACVQGDLETLRCQLLAVRVWETMVTGNWLR